MARISGVDLPRDKQVAIGLPYIFGVGTPHAQETCDALGINRETRIRDLTDDEVARIRQYIDANFRVEGDLRREVSQNVKRKVEIGTYQGLRHRRSLPVRGQRTHTNARPRKGPRQAIAGKKKIRTH